MSRAFEEIDHQTTPMGEISLRRRLEPSLQVDVYEVKLDDEFLMSSLFTASEEAVATLGLAARPGDDLDVVVGGLGLGHTAKTALDDTRVARLQVIEALPQVIGWHRDQLVPLGETLTADHRCTFVEGDFFSMVASGIERGDEGPTRFDAILLDIDHTPSHHLNPSHASFYGSAGLARLRDQLLPGGVFALWSDDPPDADFTARMAETFASVTPHVVAFPNFYTGGESACTVYVSVA
ncbi:MAG: spermidine synthase [Ilumatobacter sp.]|uniref:spermidine synthase n=1 Tax=Ilumatobacter sp. TaxID=1967498 RepID=UPI002615DB5E|nr:spermidine synthase [Ilumatobacter sp.]MDJ0770523.1 spermidine synthase [Ilumatobacter sp.]